MGFKELPKPGAANSCQVGRASWHRGGVLWCRAATGWVTACQRRGLGCQPTSYLSNEDFPRVWYLQVSLQRQKHFMNGPRLSRVEEVWQCFSETAPK